MKRTLLFALTAIIITGVASCTPPTSPTTLTPTELRYRLLDAFPDIFWCDPDFFPIGSLERELQNAINQFEGIRSHTEEFDAIVQRIGLKHKLNYTSEEQLLVYRQHKLLNLAVIEFLPASHGFNFVILVGREEQGERIFGNIATDGRTSVTRREPSYNTCPICLAEGTLVGTPNGLVAVEDLAVGMEVWTLGDNNQRVAAPILEIGMTPAPAFFKLLKFTLADGRSLTASAGHPAINGDVLGEFNYGDVLDGSVIVGIQVISYHGSTYDILPAGTTGYYWADGILLASTLKDQTPPVS
ncbi:Hint domain-containing protein [Dehalogenimonas sp. 4OHTPN]|uniref:Hint domain-containing protein n=1 Tax=Dehalogenimonas sp. 4OHTPN TaxID=3166643 RepID=A0AAU8G780_9CHLR